MTSAEFEKLKELYTGLGAEALALNHYELADRTKFGTPALWKTFLMEPEIKQYISTETAIIRNAELNKITSDLKGSRSVGQAQLISALQKLDGQSETAEGPVFIYSYVPLSEDQKAASNVNILDHDIFVKKAIPEIAVSDLKNWHFKPVFLVSKEKKMWGIVHGEKEFIIIPDSPNLDFTKIQEREFKIFPKEL